MWCWDAVLQCDDCANILCYVLFCPHLIVHDSLKHVIPSNKMVVFIIYCKNAFEITFFLIKNKVVLNTLVVLFISIAVAWLAHNPYNYTILQFLIIEATEGFQPIILNGM